MFLKSVFKLAVSLALRLYYYKSVIDVPLLIYIESILKMYLATLQFYRY